MDRLQTYVVHATWEPSLFWQGQRSHIKVKGHLRSSFKAVNVKFDFFILHLIEDHFEPCDHQRCGIKIRLSIPIIHKPQRQATLAVRGPQCIFAFFF